MKETRNKELFFPVERSSNHLKCFNSNQINTQQKQRKRKCKRDKISTSIMQGMRNQRDRRKVKRVQVEELLKDKTVFLHLLQQVVYRDDYLKVI